MTGSLPGPAFSLLPFVIVLAWVFMFAWTVPAMASTIAAKRDCDLGTTLRFEGQRGEAISGLREDVASNPELREACLPPNRELSETGDLDRALSSLQRATSQSRSLFPADVAQGTGLLKLDRPPDALAQFHLVRGLALRFAEGGPEIKEPNGTKTDDLAQFRTFETYIRENRLEEVEPLLRQYIRGHPNSWMAYYQLGYVLFRAHKIGASIEALAKSLQLNLKNAEAHKILGLNFTIIGKYDEAQLELEQAARLKPDSAEIRYFLGRIYYTKNTFPLAKREFEAAIRLDPLYMKAYDNLGLTLEPLGDEAGALANYQKAIELNEKLKAGYEWPHINVCALYNRQNKPEMALQSCQKAAEINPQSHQAFFEMARAYISRKEWDEAAKALKRAIDNNPRASKYRYVLSTVYRKLGRTDESKKELQAFRKLSAEEIDTFRKLTEHDSSGPVKGAMGRSLEERDLPPGGDD